MCKPSCLRFIFLFRAVVTMAALFVGAPTTPLDASSTKIAGRAGEKK